MKYNAWSHNRIELGIKTLTARTKQHLDDEDVIYITPPLPLWFIKKYLYRDEGAASPAEYQKVINHIHRRKVSGDRMLYVHVIKKRSTNTKIRHT